MDTVACVSVNDAFVMDAWGKSVGADGKILLLADGSALFTKVTPLLFALFHRYNHLASIKDTFRLTRPSCFRFVMVCRLLVLSWTCLRRGLACAHGDMQCCLMMAWCAYFILYLPRHCTHALFDIDSWLEHSHLLHVGSRT